ncbi:MAG TPA: hypothetical protein PLV58_09810 [Campylobacterales bacterium]|nr:hypothetical protein [Campylobacterales bacterium]
MILPYEEYSKLIKQSATKESLKNGGFSKFVGVLSQDFQTDDAKYQEIVK